MTKVASRNWIGRLPVVCLQLFPLAACLWLATNCELYATDIKKRENVIIILADDLGYGDLACYGHPDSRRRIWTEWPPKAHASPSSTRRRRFALRRGRR